MRSPCSKRPFALVFGAAFLAGCGGPPDPIEGYVWIGQWAGDNEVEEGPTVCSVARGRALVHYLAVDTNVACDTPLDNVADQLKTRWTRPSAFGNGIEPPEELAWSGVGIRVQSHGRHTAVLEPFSGVSILEDDGYDALYANTAVRWEPVAPLTELEVDDRQWAWTADWNALVGVDMTDPANGPHVLLDVGGPIADLAVDGNHLVVLAELDDGDWPNDLVVIDIADPAVAAVQGTMSLPGTRFESVGIQGATAWLNAQEDLYAVALDDPTAPVVVDEAGVEAVNGEISMVHGHYLFQTPGPGEALAVTDISDAHAPEPFWELFAGNGTWDVAMAGHTIYTASGSGGVTLWGPPRDYADVYDELEDEINGEGP